MTLTFPVECGDSDCKTRWRGFGDKTCFGRQHVSTEERGVYWEVLRGGVTEIPLEGRYCSNLRGDEVVKGIKESFNKSWWSGSK